MAAPYRDPEYRCPSCGATLRSHLERLCCDACRGMFVSVPDLRRSIEELLTGLEAQLAFLDEVATTRECPRCRAAMLRCRLDVHLDRKHPKLKIDLGRCDAHGVWFDRGELERVFELLHAAVWRPAYGGGKRLSE